MRNIFYFSHPFSAFEFFTRFAFSSLFRKQGIEFIIWMIFWAMCFLCICCNRTGTSHDVFNISHSFQVLWVYTVPIVAFVVYVFSLFYFTVRQFVNESVSFEHSAQKSEQTISLPVKTQFPKPTTFCLMNSSHKCFLNCCHINLGIITRLKPQVEM